ncbi:Mediator of replication checkpoint protein-like protein [Hapsidospora chrysogenum ATCC 11550]|uniref:Mediator of replication checkpoint protein-like protein n=1 Tax=Hapsidospora chrysogenum (strain ATCC 11550 / CBS 779.69 / DSM 880 / IAM 14645 / JCM 23072 / IMI 49137) TaxID=857340 RepID=A0A086T5V7_HAPC1|nr:Mediator of replication checkpoint protein-like protein [Hapsidospora chrysogenum ATCC 11550]
MASTRSVSPASGVGSPEPLTPRSKIRALLAAVDSSDDENTGETQQKPPRRLSPQATRAALRTAVPSQHTDDDSNDESDVEVRPRGRLAARMHGAVPTAQRSSVEVVPKEKDDASTDEEESRREDVNMPDAEDEDDDLPVASRRLKRKTPREKTPVNVGAEGSLFVSSPARPSPTKTTEQHSDSEDDLPATKSDRFKALVERKKQERLAREAVEEARKAERRARLEKLSSELDQLDSDRDGNPSDITDDEGGRKLTQEHRPARKASKKAIEEMNRETQRMQRSMQLAHEAKTRKKISKNSLFERFNFRPTGQPEPKMSSSSRPGTPQSDIDMKDAETPPSSPPVVDAKNAVGVNRTEQSAGADDDQDELPMTEQLISSQPAKLDIGKGKEVAIEEPNTISAKPKRQVRVRIPRPAVNLTEIDSDDDELEITATTKDRLNAIFDHIPTQKEQDSNSLKVLRALAQVHSPGKESRRKKDHSGMTASELQGYLQQKARQQAKLERDQRLNMLKAQGVVVQTTEERERQMQEVEDIVAKAREEAQQIMQQERAAAKKGDEDGEHDPLAWDDSEDEEYEDLANQADGEASAIELSGSEEEGWEGEEEEEEDGGSDEEEAGGVMIDGAAEDGQSEVSEEPQEEGDQGDEDNEDDEAKLAPNHRRRPRNQLAILSDDDMSEVEATPKPKSATQATPAGPRTDSPGSVLRSAKKSFIPGLPVAGPAGLGLTQIFSGTMDDNQVPAATGPTQSMMPDFDNFPDSNFSATMDNPFENSMEATQNGETQVTTQGVQLNFTQTQMHGLDSLMRDNVPNTQLSELMEVSQDVGIQEYTPLKNRFVDVPPSTVDTVVLGGDEATQHDSPLIRRGRLRRKMDMSTTATPAGDAVPAAVEGTPTPAATGFNAIKEGAERERKRRVMEAFNRKKSKAKEMVEEHAEESEDEYQGLGGHDGEDSDDESTASVKDMIDDATGNDADDRKLAAFYADRERANDEKQVEQLFKDITNGMLRRKRGADYDLSDSDDGGETRRKMKRRQFAKMQKTLFADERVKKMAENPGNQAFLKTIEDRDSDDEMDFLDAAEEPTHESPSSQDERGARQQQQQQVIPDSQPRSALGNASDTNKAQRNPRRTKHDRKPAHIGEVRQTLSNLLEDEREGSVIPATEAGSDSEEDAHPSLPPSDKENHAPPRNPRRTGGIVDRISLKRNSSSTLSSASGTSRLAFTGAQASSSSSSFKVPALLRRATTNSLVSTTTTSSCTSSSLAAAGGGFGDEAKIKRAAGKKSGVNAFARESERRAKIQQSERRREERKVKDAERRIGVVGGLFGKGSFE